MESCTPKTTAIFSSWDNSRCGGDFAARSSRWETKFVRLADGNLTFNAVDNVLFTGGANNWRQARFVRYAGVHETPSPTNLSSLASKYAVSSGVVEDLYAPRRAGARDAELINLLQQKDRGGLDPERARALVAELPDR